jgi:hypothetical protein
MKKQFNNQDMFLSIIKRTAFPEMNSGRIIDDLENNATLWSVCCVEKKGTWKENEGSFSLSLLDFSKSKGKEDTLSICSSNVDNNKLFEIAKEWGADRIEWKKKRTDSDDELASLELWWNRQA